MKPTYDTTSDTMIVQHEPYIESVPTDSLTQPEMKELFTEAGYSFHMRDWTFINEGDRIRYRSAHASDATWGDWQTTTVDKLKERIRKFRQYNSTHN
jgi:hypothetical protein